jgi:hypothetical protein
MSLSGPNGNALRATTVGIKEASRIIGHPEQPLSEIRRSGGLQTIAVMRDAIIVPHLDRHEVVRVRDDIDRRRNLSAVPPMFGIPLYGFEQIVSFGDLGILDYPYFHLRYSRIQTTDEHVRVLRNRLVAGSGDLKEDAVPIMQAMRAVRGGLKPWGTVINGMLTGHLRYHLTPDPSLPLVRSVKVRTDDLLRIAAGGSLQGPKEVNFSTKLSKRDAGDTLNVAAREYTQLFSDLPTAMVPVVDVVRIEEIARTFIAPLEVQALTGWSLHEVGVRARKAGLARSSPAGYSREHAEQVLGLDGARQAIQLSPG